MKRVRLALVLLAAAVLGSRRPGGAETLRPLVTEDVDTLGQGQVEVQVAFDAVADYRSPTQDISGTLFRGPTLGLALGLGGHSEVQLRAPLMQVYDPAAASSRTGSGDLTLAVKVRILGGGGVKPGLGARVLVKLPNLNEQDGIGTDETDVTLEFLAGVDLAGASIQANLGYAILGNPEQLASQDDKVVVGVGAFLPVGLFDLGADLHGVAWGDNSRPDEWTAILGAARTLGHLRLDAGAGVLRTRGEGSFLLTVGASRIFQPRKPR